ncbi:hypothetical protein [Rothia mucilaginosa]|uniref:hypothetical protein n=1 Tax=Rothia mucilaginosa TaxID=43675 RepID=UPI0028DD070D|nr:hypothetical protein [Rothia mucilaginosa]
MSNIFSNLRWGILPLVLVTTTAMAMSTPASAMSTVNFSDSNLTHQEIKESLDNLKALWGVDTHGKKIKKPSTTSLLTYRTRLITTQ